MWHKVSPISFRIPYIKTWKSAWFANKADYKTELSLDLTIRQTLDKELTWIPVWDTLISIEQDTIQVDIYTIKASLVLGKTGENLEKIIALLCKKTGKKVNVDVREIKNWALNAKIVWFDVKTQIEKRMPYKRAIKQAIQKSMEKWAKWIKIKIGWRLNGAEIARKETFKEGNIPTQTIRADIDYTTIRAETVYGTLWLKIWIYKGDIYKKSK